ncbi:unnamed protein product, partial [Mesorhabditis belari]|uniref:Uncharacterized protein n=1 Tax=Mesorhabditis belari TaxID=2138241 RepID=A0AAF3JAU0_9BILA
METQLDKIMLGLSSLMSIAVLLDIVGEAIPRNQTFPLIGIYITVCVSIIAVGCVILLWMPFVKDLPLQEIKKKNFLQRILSIISRPNIILLGIFQGLNVINIIVFFSFWRTDRIK